MATLLDELPSLARTRGARSAVRTRRVDGTWTHLCWAELDALVARAAGALSERAQRGARVPWSAVPEASAAVDLALLHLGAVSEARDDGGALTIAVEDLDRMLALRDEPARLVRLRADLRASDAAAVREGRPLDHAAVVRHARRAAHALEGAADVLVSGPASLLQSAGWGALIGGYGRVIGGAELVGVAEPDAWVCTAAELARLDLARSRLGPAGALARAWSPSTSRLGPRLTRVRVVGHAPSDVARALRDRGIDVGPWIAEEA